MRAFIIPLFCGLLVVGASAYQPQISGGAWFGVAANPDGRVVSWGSNDLLQLGDGGVSGPSSASPVFVTDTPFGADTTNIIAVSAGLRHCVALKGDGSVWSWGGNVSGALGRNVAPPSYNGTEEGSPGQVFYANGTPLTGVKAVSAGQDYSLALLANGKVVAWGVATQGVLGDGGFLSMSERPSAAFVEKANPSGSHLDKIVAISAGRTHALALDSKGLLWTWGSGNYGTLSDANGGGNLPLGRAERISALSGIVQIATGLNYSVALGADGKVWTWGYNDKGQLTLPSGTTYTSVPSVVKAPGGADLDGIVAIAAHTDRTVALRYDGTAWMWGSTEGGPGGSHFTGHAEQVLDGSGNPLVNVVAVGAGATYRYAVQADGTFFEWGWNGWTTMPPHTISAAAGTMLKRRVPAVAAGKRHLVAMRRSDGLVRTWGGNLNGQLGDGTYTDQILPVTVVDTIGSPIASIKAVAAGGEHSTALRADGRILSWGRNDQGQLGDGGSSDRNAAAYVTDAAAAPAEDFIGMEGGALHTVALKSDGTVWAWGDNSGGQLGDGLTVSQANPVQVIDTNNQPLEGMVQVSAGETHSLALKVDGTVWAWGKNQNGQLGNGVNFSDSTKAVQVSGLANVVCIATGIDHCMAMLPDGTIRVWGRGYNSNSSTPAAINQPYTVTIGGITGANSIALSGSHCVVVGSTGFHIWGWGAPYAAFVDMPPPRPTPWGFPAPIMLNGYGGSTRDYSNIISVTAGVGSFSSFPYFTAYEKSDGTIWVSGNAAMRGVGTPGALAGYNQMPSF